MTMNEHVARLIENQALSTEEWEIALEAAIAMSKQPWLGSMTRSQRNRAVATWLRDQGMGRRAAQYFGERIAKATMEVYLEELA